ncbi:MAG: 3-phosphoserine/phosphohydroxythreonine transaminase [Gammaproteobacteria bacterium]|nr:3-phosphoserine/phosphohydroxythreonine transaminase [Gammaproteobacteria bacterium]
MTRAFNFSAGPATLPEPVLLRAQEELLDYQGRGLSVMEMSHRSREFMAIAEGSEASLREILQVPDSYRVLFLQGGASLQFAAVPLNLRGDHQRADYINTGHWSKKAIAEAKRFVDVNVAASSEDDGFSSVPDPQRWQLDPAAAYVHIVSNETIGGVEYHFVPDTGGVPLVTDASSTILSRPMDVEAFGLIYAGAQKNLGPAGLCIVVVRDDLIARTKNDVPSMLDYAVQAENGSMYNTPATFAWYLTALVLDWVRDEGGLEEMAVRNRRKAQTLYTAIDESNFYASPVTPKDRSLTNVPFTLANDGLDALFLGEAESHQLLNLKGHRSVGGMRASLYNAVGQDAVDALVGFMRDFEARHG